MLFRKKLILGIVSFTIITSITITTEAVGETTRIKVSGGEDHTLVLPEDKFVWGCGANSAYQLGIGDDKSDRSTLIRVYDGDMNTPSGYLEDINDIHAGWKHSLALDVNGFVWAWGWNSEGQLGNNGEDSYKTTPILVHGPNDVNYLENIISISASPLAEAESIRWLLTPTISSGPGAET